MSSLKTSIIKFQQWSVKNCKVYQHYPGHPLSVGLYLYLISKQHIFSQALTPVMDHITFFKVGSRKKNCLFLAKHLPKCLLQKNPLIRQFPEKKNHMTKLTFQRIQKCPLQALKPAFFRIVEYIADQSSHQNGTTIVFLDFPFVDSQS